MDSRWEEVDIKWSDHIGQSKVANDIDMEARIEAVVNMVVPFDRPLWHVEIIENTNGDSAAVFSVNHSIGDGLRLVRASSIFTRFEDGSPATLELLNRISKNKQKRPSIFASLGKAVMDFGAVLVADQKCAETGTCLHAARDVFPVENKRSIAHSEVSLQVIKDIKNKMPPGSTVNDVVLTAFEGAIRRYLERENDPALLLPNGPLMRSFCAFSMPDIKARVKGPDSLYNEFVMPSIDLSLEKDRDARFAATRATMAEVKTSFQGYFTLILSSILGQLGLEGFAGETNLKIFRNHSFVYSNVPGYESQVYGFGQKMTGLQAYYNNMISQTIFISCMGRLTFNLMTDKKTVKDPQFLVDSFVAEVDDWHKSVNAT